MNNTMIQTTNTHGFHLTFANGINVSVQWGYKTYSENRNNRAPEATSPNAEVAAWDKAGNYLGESQGWQTPDQVAALISKYATMKPE